MSIAARTGPLGSLQARVSGALRVKGIARDAGTPEGASCPDEPAAQLAQEISGVPG